MIRVLNPGGLTTVQDFGRVGYASLGYPECGAADRYAMQLANLLCGNGARSNCAVLEMTLTGGAFLAESDMIAAVTGAAAAVTRNGEKMPMFAPIYLSKGDELKVGMAKEGLRSYLAVWGGIDVPPVLGSRSTDLKCRLGGFQGRALKKDDLLPVGKTAAVRQYLKLKERYEKNCPFIAQPQLTQPQRHWRIIQDSYLPQIRVTAGPQAFMFTEEGLADFQQGIYTITKDSNRMACKCRGRRIQTVHGSDILSDGILAGSIQVASDGQPIVMLADHQTTGGYAKIGTVITADLPVMAQLKPGDLVSFQMVTVEEATKAVRKQAADLIEMEAKLL